MVKKRTDFTANDRSWRWAARLFARHFVAGPGPGARADSARRAGGDGTILFQFDLRADEPQHDPITPMPEEAV